MISNQVLQQTIEGIRDVSGFEMAVFDTDAREIVSTAPVFSGSGESAAELLLSDQTLASKNRYLYVRILDGDSPEYVLVLNADSDAAVMTGKLAALQIQSLLNAFREHYDKDSFIKNLLLDNLLLVDIYGQAKKLHIPADADRLVILVETKPDKDRNALEALQEIAAVSHADFVTAVDENNVVIVKNVENVEKPGDMDEYARQLSETLSSGGFEEVRIAYGTVVGEIKEVSRSYKEAKMALDVSKIFFAERNVIAYNELGIGRLIYQLPIPLCRMFIREIFKGKSPEDFDEETLTTINKFFENSLNVSETSRQLFIHRNTLVYRLDKLQKSTGLDLRVFEDAITFKIALMVVKYMKYMEQYEY